MSSTLPPPIGFLFPTESIRLSLPEETIRFRFPEEMATLVAANTHGAARGASKRGGKGCPIRRVPFLFLSEGRPLPALLGRSRGRGGRATWRDRDRTAEPSAQRLSH